jgi:hypothetical protein
VKEIAVPGENHGIDLSQVTDKLYHLRLQIYKAGRELFKGK